MLLPALREAASRGTAMLLVEQAIASALSVADRGDVLSHGSVATHGDVAYLRQNHAETEARYLSSDTAAAEAPGSAAHAAP